MQCFLIDLSIFAVFTEHFSLGSLSLCHGSFAAWVFCLTKIDTQSSLHNPVFLDITWRTDSEHVKESKPHTNSVSPPANLKIYMWPYATCRYVARSLTLSMLAPGRWVWPSQEKLNFYSCVLQNPLDNILLTFNLFWISLSCLLYVVLCLCIFWSQGLKAFKTLFEPKKAVVDNLQTFPFMNTKNTKDATKISAYEWWKQALNP